MSATATASNLDIEKFGKVRRLMDKGATEGERKAARSAATKMAARAGLSLKEAVSKMDAPPATKPANFFEGFDDWMEQKEPGWIAKQAAGRAAKARLRDIERRRVIAEYGSEEAVFAETERECLLRDALTPIADWSTYSNSPEAYISGFAGWRSGDPPEALWRALEKAYPFPTDLHGVWAEFLEWKTLDDDRYAIFPDGEPSVFVRARVAALEHHLDTMAAPSWEGMRSRIGWLNHRAGLEYSRGAAEDKRLSRRLWQDFEALCLAVKNGQDKGCAQSASPSIRRTNADKRADVLSMLDEEPSLSDREISRRCGVSPQTVGNWRKRRGGKA